MPNGAYNPPDPDPEMDHIPPTDPYTARHLREDPAWQAKVRNLQKKADKGDEEAVESLRYLYAAALGDDEPMEPYEPPPPPAPPPAPEPATPAETPPANDGFFASVARRVFIAALVVGVLLLGLWWALLRDPSTEAAASATTTGSTQPLIINQPTAEPGGQPTIEELRAAVPYGSINWTAEKVADFELPPDPIQPTPIGHVFTGTLTVNEVCDDQGCIQTSQMDLGRAVPVGDIPEEPWVLDAQLWNLDSSAHYLSASYGDLQCVYLRRHTWELEVTDADWDGERWVATALSGSLFIDVALDESLSAAAIDGGYCPPYHEANEWFVEAVRG